MKLRRVGRLAFLLSLLLLLASCSPTQDAGQGQSADRQETPCASSEAAQAGHLYEYDKGRQEAEALIEGYLQKSVSYKPLSDPEDLYNLSEVTNVHMVSMLTGEYSLNQTKTRYGVGERTLVSASVKKMKSSSSLETPSSMRRWRATGAAT